MHWLLLLLLCTAGVHASDRALKVSIDPVKAPLTRPFDPSLALASPDIEATDWRVAKAAPGCDLPEQVWQHQRQLITGSSVQPLSRMAPPPVRATALLSACTAVLPALLSAGTPDLLEQHLRPCVLGLM